jgi:hypothetical protein
MVVLSPGATSHHKENIIPARNICIKIKARTIFNNSFKKLFRSLFVLKSCNLIPSINKSNLLIY